jgi:hypothetical protein
MTAVRTAALLVCLSCPAAAEDWIALTGPEITQALTARVLGYPDGTLQDFKDGGQTIAGAATGRWTVQGDLYCSVWPPSDRWDCYDVARSARGLDIRFTGDDGSVTVGRYVDLQ